MSDSAGLEKMLAETEDRAEQLRERLTELDKVIEERRCDLGKAVALGLPEKTLTNIRAELRDSEDEQDSSERAVVFLADETERIAAELASARAAEAALDRDVGVTEAVAAIDELSAALSDWLQPVFLPLAEQARDLSVQAVAAEKRAANLAGERLPSVSRTQRDGWAHHPGLEAVTDALRRYGR